MKKKKKSVIGNNFQIAGKNMTSCWITFQIKVKDCLEMYTTDSKILNNFMMLIHIFAIYYREMFLFTVHHYCRVILQFTAMIRLPEKMSKREKLSRMYTVVDALYLTDCLDTGMMC